MQQPSGSEAGGGGTGDGARTVIAGVLGRYLAGPGVRAVRVAGDTAEPPLMAYLTHFPRLSVVLDGCHAMSIARSGEPVTIHPRAGSVVFVPAHCWNLPHWREPFRDLTVLFGRQHVGVSLVDHPGGPAATPVVVKTSVAPGPDHVLRHLLDGCSAAAASPATADDGLIRAAIAGVLHACLNLLRDPPPAGPQKGRRAYESICLYVHENAHRPISRETVAADFGLSPNHVSRLFRQAGPLGFNATLNGARVDRAKVFLGQYGTPLKEVARHCGFATTAYFCRTFKRVTQRTPTEYRLATYPDRR